MFAEGPSALLLFGGGLARELAENPLGGGAAGGSLDGELPGQAQELLAAAVRALPMETLVAEGPEGIVGFVCFSPEARAFTLRQDAAEIGALYLLRSTQGLGLGRRLLEAALGHLPPHQDVVLYVLDKNRRAIRFYESMGFRLTGRTLRQETDGGVMVELEMLRSGREG